MRHSSGNNHPFLEDSKCGSQTAGPPPPPPYQTNHNILTSDYSSKSSIHHSRESSNESGLYTPLHHHPRKTSTIGQHRAVPGCYAQHQANLSSSIHNQHHTAKSDGKSPSSHGQHPLMITAAKCNGSQSSWQTSSHSTSRDNSSNFHSGGDLRGSAHISNSGSSDGTLSNLSEHFNHQFFGETTFSTLIYIVSLKVLFLAQ